MPSISGMDIRHSSAMNGAFSGAAAANKAEAIVVPTPFKLDSAVIACSRLGSFRNAFFVSCMTARGVFILIRYDSCGYDLPLCAFVGDVKDRKNGKISFEAHSDLKLEFELKNSLKNFSKWRKNRFPLIWGAVVGRTQPFYNTLGQKLCFPAPKIVENAFKLPKITLKGAKSFLKPSE